MTMHKALQPKDDINRLYVSKKGEWRGVARTEDSVDASIREIEDNIKKSKEGLITATKNRTDNIKINRTITTRRQKWEGNDRMDISSDKLTKSHMRRSGQG